MKKKKKRVERKMGKCPRYLKQWVLRCLPEKKMNKIALLYSKSFQVLKERYFQGAK
jgi:hypothetical protein